MVGTFGYGAYHCLEIVLAQSMYLLGHARHFPELRKVGGKVGKESRNHHVWDLRTIFALSWVENRAGCSFVTGIRALTGLDGLESPPVLIYRQHPLLGRPDKCGSMDRSPLRT